VASVVFGFVAVGLNWAFPDVVLPVLLNVVGSTLLVTWAAVAVSQIILRRRAERTGTELPIRMWGFPWLSWLCVALIAGVVVLAAFDTAARTQLLLTAGLTLALWVVARLTRRR